MASNRAARSVDIAQRLGRAVARTPGIGVLWAPPRAAGFALGTIFKERLGLADPDLPKARPSLALTAQVALDEALLGVMRNPRRYPTDGELSAVADEMDTAVRFYERNGWLKDPTGFHPDPPPLVDVTRSMGWAMGMWYERLSWPSGYTPPDGVPGAERWDAYSKNRRAWAYLVRSKPERPWLVCIHGFGTGVPMSDFFAFRAKRLSEELKLNLAFAVLPLHGPRRASRMSGAELLSYNLLDFVFGMGQAVWDLRRLIGWLRNDGAQQIGFYGMSLGSYAGALLAGLEPGLDFAMAGVPLCDMGRMIDHHATSKMRSRASRLGLGLEKLMPVYSVVSPLSWPSNVPADRSFMYAGLGDRMSTPGQAQRLWHHWGEPRVLWYEGSHLTFLWSGKVARFLESSLAEVGWIDGPPPAIASSNGGPPAAPGRTDQPVA
jgi:hypothetical protein